MSEWKEYELTSTNYLELSSVSNESINNVADEIMEKAESKAPTVFFFFFK